jgi:DNA primase
VPNRIIRDELSLDLAQKLGIDSAVLRQELKSVATRRSSPAMRPNPDSQISSSEKILVRAASSVVPEESGMRRTVLEALATERLHAGLTSESLLETLLTAGEELEDPMTLPLSDADRQLLARIVMREETPISEELLEGALQAMRHRTGIAQREREIKQGIAEAERRNDVTTLVRLKQEKLELDRKLAGTSSS